MPVIDEVGLCVASSARATARAWRFFEDQNFPAAANLGIFMADNSKATWPGLHVVFCNSGQAAQQKTPPR
jgi:hypothetical protein